MTSPGFEFRGGRLPSAPHEHVFCDACRQHMALVWYRRQKPNDTLTLCGHHATLHEVELSSQGYETVRDFRAQPGEELRRRLTEPAPSVAEILAFEAISVSFRNS